VGDLLRIDRVHSVDGARRELLARSAGPAVNAVVDDKTSLCFYMGTSSGSELHTCTCANNDYLGSMFI
jgi:hypothetical protein